MVAIFTGAGTGFERGSGNVIGAAGLLGSAAQGRGGDNLFLNAANGNLMISRQDEFLSGRGPDVGITRTYNSLGNFSDDNGDNWRQSMDRRVFGLTGTANSSGSKVKRRGADGAEISYDWDGSAYVATDGSGSYDTLTYNGTNWTWTDGDSRITEVYSAYGSEWRIASQSDTSGNSLSFSYTGANLTQITTADGGYTQLTWDGSNITSLVTYSHGTGLTRTRYGYDIQNRLSQVTVDLSPEDSSIIDDKVYTTNYSYHGSSKLVATISQTDGSHVAFTYDGSGRVDSITQTVSSGVTRTTSIAYGSGTTTITDPMGQATTLHYDGNGQLTRITAPPAQAGAPAQTVTFAYNAAGELIRSIDAGGTVTSYSYDARGNLLTRSDQTSLVIQSGPNATATLQPDGTYRISKTGGAHGVYDAQVQSVQGISGDFALRMRPLQTNKYMMAGVSQNPNYSTGYGDISFAIEAADNSLIYYYDSVPGSYGVLTPYVAGNSIWMVRTGSTINYYKGDTLETAIAAGSLRTISGASGTYYFDSAHYEGGGQADVSLTPLAPSNVVTRTYNAANQVLTETRTGSNGTAANASHTTRYVYDDLNRLVYVVSAEGHVTRNWYNEAPEYNGLLYRIDEFPEHRYDVSALTPATALSRAELDSWYANLQATAGGTSSFNIRYIGYDGRGNIAAEMQGGSNDGAGSITETDGYQRSFFTYDQAGQLLSRSRLTQYTEHFVYDGLGRLIMTTDLNTGTTSIIFNDALTQTEVRLASGLIQTSAYSKAGELLSFTESGTFTTVGTANYAYDKNGRLRVATDATGVTHYYLYDKAGRKTAEINEDGDLIEYRYDARNRLVATARYALRITDGANLSAIADPNSTIDVAAIRPPLPHDFDLWTWHVYDADGRLLQAIDGDGSTTSYDYDASGQLVRTIGYFNKLTAAQIAAFKIAAPVAVILPSTDPKDAISRVFYDKDGRTIGTLDGAGYLTQVTYDRAGRKTREVAYAKATDPALRASGTFQQLTNSTNPNPNPANRQINYVYDGQGLLRYQIDGLGQVTEYGYDSGVAGSSIGLVRKVTGYATLIDFSATGYSFSTVKAAIASSGAAGNAANRTSWAVYDTAGRVAYAIDAGGAVTGYSYDVRGQVTKQIQYATLRPTSSLPTDATMNDWALANPAQADRVTRYYRNERGETVFTVNPEGYATKTEYDAAGRKLAVRVRWDTKIEPDNSWTLAMVSAAVAGGSFVTNYYYYDNAGRLQQEYDGEFNLKWYTYYANGQLQWEISDYGGPDEVRILHEYDAAGRERYRYEAWGTPERALTEFSYDGLGNLQSVTAPGGRTTSYTHDSLGRVLTQTNAASGTTSYQYNAFGEVVRTTDQRGNSSYSYYDAQGRVVVSRDAENYLTLTSYTVFGEIETVTRKAIATNSPISLDVIPTAGPSTQDAVTRFTYDKLGRIKTTTDALENIETRWYDAFGNLSQTRNKLDGLVQYAHDRRGLLTHEYVQAPVYGGTGAQLASGFYRNIYAYDARGNMVHQIEASGLPEQRDTWFAYDRADRLISRTGGTVKTQLTDIDATPVESYTYDKRGNLIETRVEAVVGSTRTVISRTLFYYDDLDRKVAQVDPTGTVTRYAYDAAGNLKSTHAFDGRIALPTTAGGTPPAHSGTSRDAFYDYDNLGRLTKSYTAAQATGYWDAVTQQFVRQSVEVATLYEYDAAGNVTKTTDANGNVTLSYYDKLGRKTAQLDQERYQTSWAYDAEGNVLKERRFAARLPVDDPLFDIDAATIGNDRITEFSYDRLGRRLFETRIGVQAWKIEIGNSDTLSGDSRNAQIAYTYNALGQVKTKVEANGDKTEYEYDTAGRLIKETRASYTDHTGADVKPELRYFYNALDQLTATRQIGNGTDRLTANVYEDGRLRSTTDAAGFTRSYHYDAAGRLVAESYDRKLPNGGSVTEAIFYVHDAAGRVIAQTFARKDGASWVHADAGNETYVATRMRYNAHGELTGRTTTLGLVPIDEQTGYHETYAYDAFGRMWRTNAGDGVLKFHIYDKAGNQTLTLTSAGADLSSLTVLNYADSVIASGDTHTADAVTTITAYDKRGMVT